MIEIPLSSNPEQLFNATIAGKLYDIRVILNSRSGVWSISFSSGGEDILLGVNLVGGVDVVRAHNLPFKNLYVVNLESNRDPSKSNLGSISKLVILEDEELNV